MSENRPVGELIAGRFRIEAVAGVGGMSTVYRAHDENLGRTVAVKVFPPGTADPDARRRASEVRLLAGLDHPALVTLFDVVDSEDGVLIVMQFVDGDDLGARLAAGRLTPDETAAAGGAIASALTTVHAQGIVHRDIKPGNILIPTEHPFGAPSALLADFGIARLIDDTTLTAAGSVIGTAQYLSPEQARGTEVSGASDIYSLGLVLLEALTGERSFGGSGVEAVVARLTRDPSIPETLPAGWRSLLREMTSRDPAARPSASAVWTRIDGLGSGAPGSEQAASPADSPTMPMAPPTGAYAPTRRLEAASATRPVAVPTEVIAPTSIGAARSRRPLIVAAAVVVALVIGGIATSVSLSGQNPAVAPTSPSESSVAPVQQTPIVATTETPAPADTAVVPPVPTTDPADEKGPGKGKPCKVNGKGKGKKNC